MYHLELRKFPHTVCRFNQSEQQLRQLVVPWVNEQWFEEGERKWNSNEATLTVLEGPKLSMPELAMGRGWRNAQRRSQDVTERVLGAVRRAGAPAAGGEGRPAEGAGTAVQDATGAAQLLADSLALELLALLDADHLTLARVWALAHERLEAPTAAESLALGEGAVRSLLARGLVVLEGGPTDSSGGTRTGGDTDALLRAVASWSAGAPGAVAVARSG